MCLQSTTTGSHGQCSPSQTPRGHARTWSGRLTHWGFNSRIEGGDEWIWRFSRVSIMSVSHFLRNWHPDISIPRHTSHLAPRVHLAIHRPSSAQGLLHYLVASPHSARSQERPVSVRLLPHRCPFLFLLEQNFSASVACQQAFPSLEYTSPHYWRHNMGRAT